MERRKAEGQEEETALLFSFGLWGTVTDFQLPGSFCETSFALGFLLASIWPPWAAGVWDEGLRLL